MRLLPTVLLLIVLAGCQTSEQPAVSAEVLPAGYQLINFGAPW